jgi:hypothetical protein
MSLLPQIYICPYNFTNGKPSFPPQLRHHRRLCQHQHQNDHQPLQRQPRHRRHPRLDLQRKETRPQQPKNSAPRSPPADSIAPAAPPRSGKSIPRIRITEHQLMPHAANFQSPRQSRQRPAQRQRRQRNPREQRCPQTALLSDSPPPLATEIQTSSAATPTTPAPRATSAKKNPGCSRISPITGSCAHSATVPASAQSPPDRASARRSDSAAAQS